MLKKNKKIVALLFSLVLICGTVYGNVEFLKGRIFAETDEETSESVESSSVESSSQKENLDSSSEEDNPPIESQEEEFVPQQVENIARGATVGGWKVGTANDFIENKSNKISWNNGGSWWYTYNNTNWVYSTSIEAALIVNGTFLNGTSENTNYGFLWGSKNESVYSINTAAYMLKRSFPYKTYQIDIIQQLLEDGAVEISYQVTNKNLEAQKIGVSQYVDILDSAPISALTDFKGLNMANVNTLVMMPDSETMPNWSSGGYARLKGFTGYSPKTVNGSGWESGKQQPDSSVELKEHKSIALGDSGAVMKNPGVMVGPSESTTFKQIIKFGEMVPPTITVDQTTESMYTSESVDITGTISDSNNQNYRLYLELDDVEKTLVPLKDFKNIPLQTVQNYQATIEGKYFTLGNHTVSIIGIDEYGARSVDQKMTFVIREVSGVPLIQKLKIGEKIQTDITKLFGNIVGNGTKLKSVSMVDSKTVGFRWAEAVLVDSALKEEVFKIPVAVYDEEKTLFNDKDNIAINAKNIGFTMSEVASAIQENRLNEYILNQSEVKAWQMENGEEANVTVVSQNVKPQFGIYESTIKATRKDTGKVLEKKISISVVEEPLKDGWEFGSSHDFILNNGYKIEWNQGAWWYTFNGNKWMFGNSIEASLIINDAFPANTSDVVGSGFLWKNLTESAYSINKETNSIRRTIYYLDRYKIDMIQRLLGNNAVEITYEVTNLGSETQKIGLSQYVDTYVGSDSVPVTPINNFKGINLTSGQSSLVIIPDTKTMPNWAAGKYNATQKFNQYSMQNANGIGWETGKRYRDSSGNLFFSPDVLKENQPVNLGDSAVSMKNPGVDVPLNDSISFKQIIKYGTLSPPIVTVDQSAISAYKDEVIKISGTISDSDNKNYKLYMQLNDSSKTLVDLKDFIDIPYNDIQNYQAEFEAKQFAIGKHQVSILGIDEYGTRSVLKKLDLTITELSAVPLVQKIKIGESISNELNKLFKDIKGINVTLKYPMSVDSSKIGFQWVTATLIDEKAKEINLFIPINVYNSESTLFNDVDKIALDSKDVVFKLVDVKQATETGKLDELVTMTVAPKSWDITNGATIPTTLLTNGIKPLFGKYNAQFKAKRSDNGKSLEKTSILNVAGELKFKSLPTTINFKTTKLSGNMEHIERIESEWKIEIENTLASNWYLNVTAVPFESPGGNNSGQALIFKDNQNEEKVINSISQKIASGSNEAYPIIQWGPTKGLLVKVKSDAKIGTYKGLINWTLTDAP